MINLQQLILDGVVSFKEVVLDLDTHPLTFVRGMNLDSQPEADGSYTGNGSGKSLLYSAIPNLRFSAPPLASKKKSKRDLLSTSKSRISLLFENGKQYEVQQTASKFVVFEDDVDLKIRTVPLAEEYLDQIFPSTPIEWYSTVYLSTQRDFPLQTATDVVRLEYLTEMFRLDYFSEMKKYFMVKARGINDDQIRISVLENQITNLLTKLDGLNASYKKEDHGSLKEDASKLQKQVDSLVQEEFKASTQIHSLVQLRDTETELDELRSKYDYDEPPDAMLTTLKKDRVSAREWEHYEKALKVYNSSLRKFQDQLDALGVEDIDKTATEVKLKAVQDKLSDAQAALDEAQAAEDNFKSVTAQINRLDKWFGSAGVSPDEVDTSTDVVSEIESCNTTLRLRSLLKHAHDDSSTCPTCLSEVDVASIRKAVDRASKRLPKLESLLEQRENVQRRKNLFKELPKDFDENAVAAANLVFDKYTRAETKLHKLLRNLEKHNAILGYIDQLEVPDKPERRKPKQTLAQIDEAIELCTDIQKHLEAKAKLMQAANVGDFKTSAVLDQMLKEQKKQKEAISVKLSGARQKLADLVSRLERIKTAKSEIEVYGQQLTDAEKEIQVLQPNLDNKVVVDALVKAYSSKGLKTQVADKICNLIETNLNHYRELVFAEPFAFSVISSEAGISIRVDRNNGQESDVRLLSGAESNSFRLLFMLSLLPLIPDSRRLNIAVLDEPTAHMDPVSRRIFVERFLPVLCEVVPHVFVITPNLDEFIEGSHEIIVTKRNGVSSI